MRTFDFLGFFVTFLRLTPGAPLVHTYEINEVNGECRTSTAVFFRLWPFRIAVALGHWTKTGLTEAEMFRKVFSSRNVDLYDENGDLDPRFRDTVRAAVAENSSDPSEEWTILQMLELDQ